MTFRATREDHGLYVRFSGLASDIEIQKFARLGQADPRYSKLRYVLNDFTECVGVSFNESVVEEFAAIDSAVKANNPRIQVVVLTEWSDVKMLVKAYFDTGFSGFNLKIFPSVALAREWLGPACY